MSHIDQFLETYNTPAPKRTDITSAWDCYTNASKTAKLYSTNTGRKNFSRRVSFAADLVVSSEESQHREVLEELVGVNWQVHKCSPLWNVPFKEKRDSLGGQRQSFGEGTQGNVTRMVVDSVEKNYDEKALKRYAMVIANYVATHSVSGEDNSYRVELSCMKGLKGMRSDKEALKVTVHTTMMGEMKLIFTGILCGVEAAEVELKSNDCFSLPVFLAAGYVDTKDRVIYGLEKCFDCVIAPLALPDTELKWMSAMWAGLEVELNGTEPSTSEEAVNAATRKSKVKGTGEKNRAPLKDKSNQQVPEDNNEANATKSTNKTSKVAKQAISDHDIVKMTFQVPRTLSELKEKMRHFTVSFPAQQLKKVWDGVHQGGDSDEFTETEMETFHTMLRSHIRTNFGVNTEQLELTQISLPFFKAHKSGKVKIENGDHVKVVLRYLTELCQGNMLQADPTLSVSVQDNVTMDWD